MRAVQITRTGGPEVLDLVTLDKPRPGPGEILVRNQAIGVNFIDTYHRTGPYRVRLPSGLGMEGRETVGASLLIP